MGRPHHMKWMTNGLKRIGNKVAQKRGRSLESVSRKKIGKSIVVKDDDGKYHWISPENRDFELETTLVIRYDNHGQEIGLHDPNKKRRSKGGWTTYFVKVRTKKK